jgi:ADP-ribose pyrophosphatase YjhB (NUDIX family)
MEEVKLERFNIRVYFLLTNDKGELLVSDEVIMGQPYTKFPGGGLEFGEGTRDCCAREAREELGQEIEVLDHIYTTDFFIRSSFYPSHQVMAVYYKARLLERPSFQVAFTPHDHQSKDQVESFRWVRREELLLGGLSFPSDQQALRYFANA